MLSFKAISAGQLARQTADRMRQRRVDAGWSRTELSARSGVKEATLRQFEETGQISLERLLKLAAALGALSEFEKLLAGPALTQLSLDDIAEEKAPRQRGRTSRRDPPTG